MKIHEVEKAVGITRKNIRFYEQEGLVHPGRNRENGYRDYTEAEVEELKKIKLLRKLSVPLEEIRRLQSGDLTLEDGLKRHLICLEREEKNLARLQEFCRLVAAEGGQYVTLDAAGYLEKMEQSEKEGMRFMNVEQTDRRKRRWRGSLIAGVVSIVFLVWFLTFMGYVLVAEEGMDAVEKIFVAVILLFPLMAIVGVIVSLIQRKKEIQGGEEDAAAKY